MMNFDEFVKEVKDNISDYLPEEYAGADIEIRNVEKLNSGYVALNVRKPDELISASVNLSNAFELYKNGAEMDDVMTDLAETAQMQPGGLDVGMLMDYERMKENLFVRVSSIENNRDFLESVPYTQIDNLALTYHVCVANDAQGMATATITNDIMDHLDISKEQLHADAMENSPKLFPANIQPMMNVMMRMAGMMPEMMADPAGRSFDAQLQDIDFGGDMLVLSNASTQNGASVLFYPEVLEKIGEQAGQNFFILPSSIHETLIVPDDGRFDYQTLESMVKEINAAEVAPEDRLSDSVYHYDSKEHLFERAEVYEMRQASKDLERGDKLSIKDQLKSAELESEKSMPSAAKEKEADIGLE